MGLFGNGGAGGGGVGIMYARSWICTALQNDCVETRIENEHIKIAFLERWRGRLLFKYEMLTSMSKH